MLAVAVVALTAVGPGAAQTSSGPTTPVAIGYSDYEPVRLDVVAGGTVEWTNESVRNHTVTDDAGAFDSGTLPSTYKFDHKFLVAGAFPYHCRLHPYIRGEVDVWDLLLDRPAAAAQANQPFPISGHSDLPGGSGVDIQADDGSGAGFQSVAQATVNPDGSFATEVSPAASASYRAVAGDKTSPGVDVLVLNHTITASARRGKKRTVVSVQVTPADPGGHVVLQLRLRERFGWWPIEQKRLDKSSRARFVVSGQSAPARVRLTLPDGATPLATSSVVRVGR